MNKYKLQISYDGTQYSGWQIQPNATSIQGLIEDALEKLLKTPTRVIGLGRTDCGVHAIGQVAHFTSKKELEIGQILRALNGMLPRDIRIKEMTAVSQTFHAQYSAIRKEYHYHVCLQPTIDPFLHHYRHHVPYTIDHALLKKAAKQFIGSHDFATFANVGTKVKTTVRTLYRLDIIEEDGGIRFEFEGDGFLYKMVRNIVGTILEVAAGKRTLEEIESLFAAKDRRAAGVAAPAKGLFLVRVDYRDETTSEKEGICENSRSNSCEIRLTSSIEK